MTPPEGPAPHPDTWLQHGDDTPGDSAVAPPLHLSATFRAADAGDFADMMVAQYDEMRAQAENTPGLVMGVALHAYVAGQPFRLRALRPALRHIAQAVGDVWCTTSDAIAEHWLRTI